jgi:hypothetical protein
MTCQDYPLRDTNKPRLTPDDHQTITHYLQSGQPWRCHKALQVGLQTPCQGAIALLAHKDNADTHHRNTDPSREETPQ